MYPYPATKKPPYGILQSLGMSRPRLIQTNNEYFIRSNTPTSNQYTQWASLCLALGCGGWGNGGMVGHWVIITVTVVV